MLFRKTKSKQSMEKKHKITLHTSPAYICMLGTHCALVSRGRLHFIHAFFVRAVTELLCAQELRD